MVKLRYGFVEILYVRNIYLITTKQYFHIFYFKQLLRQEELYNLCSFYAGIPGQMIWFGTEGNQDSIEYHL